MEKQESLYLHVSDEQIGAQNKRGFPEHWWLNKVWSPEFSTLIQSQTLLRFHNLEGRPLVLLQGQGICTGPTGWLRKSQVWRLGGDRELLGSAFREETLTSCP